MTKRYDVAVVGAGIIGLAHAWIAARGGRSVVVLERDARAVGASIRNFGMIWPIGQPAGRMHDMALSSRRLWCELAEAAGFWLSECGSIHLAHRDDEWDVLQEFNAQAASSGYEVELLTRDEVLARSNAANPEGLLGGLWSPTEMCVDPREVIRVVPKHLQEQLGVQFHFSSPVSDVTAGALKTSKHDVFHADQIIVASGSDFETLFPEVFRSSGLRRCKLQMMRTVSQNDAWRIGPHLAGGLTLQHYASFAQCPSLAALKKRIADETPELNQFGIHVMASQNELGEVILGDSHEYGAQAEPFDNARIDSLILRELHKIIQLPDWTIVANWHGVYVKHAKHTVLHDTLDGVSIVLAPGGAGMTLSMGIADRIWSDWPESLRL